MARKRRLRKLAAKQDTKQVETFTSPPQPIVEVFEVKEEEPKKNKSFWSRNKSSEE